MALRKTKFEIDRMIEAGAVVAAVLKRMEELVCPDISTFDLNAEAEKIIRSMGATPSFLGYNGFKFATCMSVDDVVVHGFPSKLKLKEGQILGVDVGACLNGYHGDAARTFAIGRISADKQRLIDTARECFFAGCKYLKAGERLGSVGAAVQGHAESKGYSVVRAMAGHGIGKKLHEAPEVLNYGTYNSGMTLQSGMAIALEPMINMGRFEVYTDPNDGWVCRTKDGSMSAHYENTVIITENEPQILTLYGEDLCLKN